MQVNIIGYIELIFKDEYYWSIDVLSTIDLSTNPSFQIPSLAYHVQRRGKPIAFIWHESEKWPISIKLIKWINEEFKPLFDYDPLKWLASVGTCCPELRPYLKDFHGKTSHL